MRPYILDPNELRRVLLEMTELMKKAIRAVRKLPPDRQDSFAAFLLAELESESLWEKAFAKSPDLLEKLAAEALAEDDAGDTELLIPEEL
jgi:hypothetical protein